MNPELASKMSIELVCKLIPPENGGNDEPLTPQEEAWCEKYLYPLLVDDDAEEGDYASQEANQKD